MHSAAPIQSSVIELAIQTFGASAFGHNLFANNDSAIRLELAHGDSRIERFENALLRARTIVSDVFSESDQLRVCLTYYGTTFAGSKSLFRDLRDCEVSIGRPYFADSRRIDDESDAITLSRIFFESDRGSVDRKIWGVIARELGVQPSLGCNLYVFDPELRVLMHPYDDRGMDVLGPNRQILSEVYSKYRHWLLDYNLDEMRNRYGSPEGSSNRTGQ